MSGSLVSSHAAGTPSAPEPIRLFSIVMPAYNEEGMLGPTLDALTTHLDSRGFCYELLVVDDGSSDGTAALVQGYEARHPAVRLVQYGGPYGYGFAIRRGLECYRGDAVVVVTSDGSDSPKDVAAYFEQISAGYDCAFGSRFVAGAKVEGYPPLKLAVNRFANRMLGWLLRSQYSDFTNGFKCYRRHVIDSMQPLVSGQFNITIEMAVTATLGRWKTAVVANDWTQRSAGASTFKLGRMVRPYASTLVYCLLRNYLRSIRRG